MVTSPLRCHLLIGPPASGKTTLATILAELVGGRVLSTDAIRTELYGDAAIQGTWAEIERLYHQRIREAVADGVPVILDATHSQRPWRLAITQALELPSPVQWIGWWLTTPLEQCLACNESRERKVSAEVIQRMHGFLPEAIYVPDPIFLKKLNADPSKRDAKLAKQAKDFLDKKSRTFRVEGFSFLAALNPAEIPDLQAYCHDMLNHTIDRGIQAALNRRQNTVLLHRYSRLLDLERLFFLIRLLLEFPGVEFYDHTKDPPVELSEDLDQLRRSFRFQPDTTLPEPDQATFAVRAAFALARRHGPCYGDVQAVEEDLDWLWNQGFTSAYTVSRAIQPGDASELVFGAMDAKAGFPQAADRRIFQRQLGLLRYLIQNPFEAPNHDNRVDPSLRLMGRKIDKGSRDAQERKDDFTTEAPPGQSSQERARRQSASLRLYLLEKLQQVDGIDYSQCLKPNGRAKAKGASGNHSSDTSEQDEQKQQLSTLDKDIEVLITGYGFRNLLSSDSVHQPSA